MLRFLLMACVAYGANMADFRRSDDIEDRRAESSQESYAKSVASLELARKNLIAISRMVEDPSGHLTEKCPELKAAVSDLTSMGKAAREAGPVSDSLPTGGGADIAGLFTPADLSGVDPCTGAVSAETTMLSKGADILTRKKQNFEDRFGALSAKVGASQTSVLRATAKASAECKKWSWKVWEHMFKFGESYRAISKQLDSSKEDLLYQAQGLSRRKCKN